MLNSSAPNYYLKPLGTVAIGKSKGQGRKASHCGSK